MMNLNSDNVGRRAFVGLGGIALGVAAATRLGATPADAAPRSLHVRDFGAVPDDGRDQTAAIRRAIAAAAAIGRPTTVRFDAGTYHLSRALDLGASLPITGAAGLTLSGRTDVDGRPTTRLLSRLQLENDTAPATQFALTDCRALALQNLILDYTPRATSSGEIIAVDPSGDEIVVDVFAGSAHFDGMRCYSANSWDLSTGLLNRVAPLTIGSNPDQFGQVWRRVAGGSGRRYAISGFGFSDRVRPGDGASWHFNVAGGSYNILALGCRDLRLDNLRIHNSIGMAMLAGYGHNLTCHKIAVEPEGADLAVGPRDAIHLSNNSGSLTFTDCRLKGVRWDPLVSRSSFVQLAERHGRRQIVVQTPGASSRALPYEPGDRLTFWSGTVPPSGVVLDASPVDDTGSRQLITLEADVPDGVPINSLLSSSGHEWERARLASTTIEGNIGTALVFLNKNLLIEGCRFANNAYHDIGFGTTSGPTGSFARDVIIRDNVFTGSGWVKKYAKFDYSGAITTLANNGAFTTQPYNHGITIERNEFSDLATEPFQSGIYLRNARHVMVRDNSYRGVSHRVMIDEASTDDIEVTDP